ncbi:MAG: amidohydrolase family protein [Bacilli bacterium]|nr:amidohydrolase family protein [Bacilli bacterium]
MKKVTYINVNLYNGTENQKLQKLVNVEVTGDKITNVGSFKVAEDSKIVDLNGAFMVPGLINLHAHLPSSGKLSKKKLGDKSGLVNFVSKNPIGRLIGNALVKKYAVMALNSGVTTVRAVGGVSDLDSSLRDKINAGKILGPRLLVCNTAIGVKGGHMDGTVAKAVNDKNDIVNRIKELKEQKVDYVKLMITGGVLDCKEPGHPAPLRMSKDMVEAACKEAHKLGMKVCAHVESPEGMEVAIKCGVDSIEHGGNFDEKLCKDMVKNNQYLVTTLSPALPFFLLKAEQHGYGKDAAINSKIVFDGMVNASKQCLRNKVMVGLGTDAGSTLTSHYNFYKELSLFEKYVGVSKSFALYSATLANAKIAGIDKITGSIEVGKVADLLVVKEDPLKNLNALGKPMLVSVRGKLIKNPKVKRDKVLDSLIDPLY